MQRKRKNPFEGNANNTSRDPESMEEIIQEMKDMEKSLGKEKFNQLLEAAIRKFGKENDPDGSLDDEEDFDDDDLDYFDPVTIGEWSKTHPANLICGSDSYYADLATDIGDIISGYVLPKSAPQGVERELGRVLAAYLEDNVSGTKVFSSMRRVCLERYGYQLPFYDCENDDYISDHINEQDIRFLIWKTFCQLGKEEGTIYSPLAPGWAVLADRLFDELNSRYEEAPEATRVADWLRKSFRKGEYIDIREIAGWLVFRNPLCYIPDFLNSIEEQTEKACMDDSSDAGIIEMLAYGLMSSESWQRSMSPMGCPSRILTAALAAEFGYDKLADDIDGIEVLPKQIYAIAQDKKTRRIFFETSDNKSLEVERDSFAKGFRPDSIQYADCNLIKYKGKYLLNGMLLGEPALKKLWENQKPFSSFEQQRELVQEWIAALDGQQVVCVSNIKSFFKKLGLPPKDENPVPGAKNYVVFLSKELGIALVPDLGFAFDIPGNRSFRKRIAARDSFNDVIFHNEMPHDVALYIQEHNLLPEAAISASQGKETGKRIVQDYLAFWIGFYRELSAYGNGSQNAFDGNTNDDADRG